jgi:predicted alpha/beta hydrolase
MPRKPVRPPPSETVELRTRDGWSLRADVHEPAHDPAGVVVLAHAMMARRSSFDRAKVARFFVDRGWRVVAFDFRGHGDSGPRAQEGASWSYDDLVRRDLPAAFAFARGRERKKRRIVLVGHSLGGHVGLASQGTSLVAFDAIVALGANVWLRQDEPSLGRWIAKRAVLAAVVATCRRVGRFPVRALRLGSDDEARTYFEDFDRYARTGRWTSADGSVDYLAALTEVRVPVLQVVGEADRLACAPECGVRFVERCGGPHEVMRAGVDHMGLVTSEAMRGSWDRVESWIRAAVLADRSSGVAQTTF